MPKKAITLTPDLIHRYARQLREQERSVATIRKYVHDLTALAEFLGDRPLTKAALNGFLSYLDRRELRLRPLKIQKALFLSEDKELTRAEYVRLVRAAEGAENRRPKRDAYLQSQKSA